MKKNGKHISRKLSKGLKSKREPQSYSDLARRLEDVRTRYINNGWSTVQRTLLMLSKLYVEPRIVRSRVAARIGRLIRQGKIKGHIPWIK